MTAHPYILTAAILLALFAVLLYAIIFSSGQGERDAEAHADEFLKTFVPDLHAERERRKRPAELVAENRG